MFLIRPVRPKSWNFAELRCLRDFQSVLLSRPGRIEVVPKIRKEDLTAKSAEAIKIMITMITMPGERSRAATLAGSWVHGQEIRATIKITICCAAGVDSGCHTVTTEREWLWVSGFGGTFWRIFKASLKVSRARGAGERKGRRRLI